MNHKVIIGNSMRMNLVKDNSIQLIITSPPYWDLKDYNHKEQIGFNQTYLEYISSLNNVWRECFRVLQYSCYLCIVVGNYFTTTKSFGRYKTISIKTDIISFLEDNGFDLRSEIIWRKISTTNTSGGCNLMGSIYFPRNPIPTQEQEYILIFKKITPRDKRNLKANNPKGMEKEKSRIQKEEFFKLMRNIWEIPGKKQKNHKAVFPLEIPMRLVKLYSFYGETVLDPFLGSGTTSLACKKLNRNSVGYELNEKYLSLIKEKMNEEGLEILYDQIN